MIFRIKQRWWQSLLATAVLWAVAWTSGALARPQGRLGSNERALTLGVAAALGCLVLNGLIDRALWLFFRPRYTQAIHRFAMDVSARMGPAEAVAGGVMAGLGEEPFFRALLIPLCGPPAVAVPVVAVIFGMAHYIRRGYFGFLIWGMGEGLVFGTLYVATESVIVPAVAHGVFDMFGFFYFLLLRQRSGESRAL
jgi:hypothetical protein